MTKGPGDEVVTGPLSIAGDRYCHQSLSTQGRRFPQNLRARFLLKSLIPWAVSHMKIFVVVIFDIFGRQL